MKRLLKILTFFFKEKKDCYKFEDNPAGNETLHSNILFIVLLPFCYAFNII